MLYHLCVLYKYLFTVIVIVIVIVALNSTDITKFYSAYKWMNYFTQLILCNF